MKRTGSQNQVMNDNGRTPTATTRCRRPGRLLAAGVVVALGVAALGGCVNAGSSGDTGPIASVNQPGAGASLPPSVGNGPCLSATDPAELCGVPVGSPLPGTGLPSAQDGVPGSSGAPFASDATGPIVTMADDGRTLRLAVGQQFTLDLGEGVVWTVKVADDQIIHKVAGAPLAAGAQGVYEAGASGSTVLSASGMPHCTSGPCALFRLGFSITIAVG